jgi:natural product precursor
MKKKLFNLKNVNLLSKKEMKSLKGGDGINSQGSCYFAFVNIDNDGGPLPGGVKNKVCFCPQGGSACYAGSWYNTDGFCTTKNHANCQVNSLEAAA